MGRSKQLANKLKIRTKQQKDPVVGAIAPKKVNNMEVRTEITVTNGTPPKSIRYLITSMLKAGETPKAIEAAIITHFPQSVAAQKATKHIAFYRSRMKAAEARAKVGSE